MNISISFVRSCNKVLFTLILVIVSIVGFSANTYAGKPGSGGCTGVQRDFTLYVDAGTLTIDGAGGDTLDTWGYGLAAATPEFPAPQLEVNECDTVNITVINNHNISHNLVVKGLTDGDTTSIAPGDSYTYSFTAPETGGTFIYRDTLNEINREMGLYGALVVRTADGSLTTWTGGPAYDVERSWVIGDMDKPRWNDVAGSGGNVNTSVYKPNYFIINGNGGFHGLEDPNTILSGALNDTGLVHIVNGGLFDHSLHFHGNHYLLIAVDGQPLADPEWQDTLNIRAGTSAMVLYTFDQGGTFPMHVHTAQMETANGVYLNGVATLLVGP